MVAIKDKTVFVCTECGFDSPKWSGKCPSCGMWNTMVEKTIRAEKPSATISLRKSASGLSDGTPRPETLDTIETTEEPRIDMRDAELNRVLGGGLVPGSIVLLGGEPGIGKSTLILQTVMQLQGQKVLYVSGEESARQIKMRADRLVQNAQSKNNGLMVLCETSLENIYTQIKETKPTIVVIDSIQTISSEYVESSAGSLTQVRECAA